MANKCHPQSDSPKRENEEVEEQCLPASSDMRQLPDCWSYPDVCHSRESPVCSLVERGIRLSWLHYICLVFVIICMGAILTIWTAIALHGSRLHYDPLSYTWSPQNSPSNSDHISIPAIQFNPHIVIGAIQPSGMATTATVVDTSTFTSTQISTTSNASNELSTNLATMASFAADQELNLTTTTWISTTVTPEASVIKPSTRYFNPAASHAAQPKK